MRWRDEWQERPPIFRSRFHRLSLEYSSRKRQALTRRFRSALTRLAGYRQRDTSSVVEEELQHICHQIIDKYAVEDEARVPLASKFSDAKYQGRLPPWKRYLATRCQPGRVLATSIPMTRQSWESVKRVWSKAFPRLVSSIANGVYTMGNVVKIYDDGQVCFEDMLRAIRLAEKRVWIESYCIDESAVGQALCDTLVKAARKGVDVIVSVDAIGSFGVPLALRKDLREAGGHLVVFNPIWRAIGPLVYRNHRKLLVADAVGFCGSMNFDWRSARAAATTPSPSTESRGINWLIRALFRDMSTSRPADYNHHVGCVGPVVEQLAGSFCRKLAQSRLPLKREAGGDAQAVAESFFASGETDVVRDVFAQVVENDGKDRLDYTQAIVKMLSAASRSVVVASSYFHPPGNIRRALGRCFRRGVSSLILLSGLSDVPFDSKASLAILPYFLVGKRNMCRAFFLRKAHCHTKSITVDNLVSIVGSFNLDRYSARRNCEIGLAMVDPRVARIVNRKIEEQVLDRDESPSKQAEEYKLQEARDMSLPQRLVSLASYHFVRATGCAFLDGFRTDDLRKRWREMNEKK